MVALGNVTSMGGRSSYVSGTTYSPYGEALQHAMGSHQKTVWNTYSYEEGTPRFQRQQLDRETAPTTDSDITWTYDQAGNVTTITDTTGSVTDKQCFTYDYLRRLTQAWTPPSATSCANAPAAGTLAGPAPYWDSFTYDKIGNRLTGTRRTLSTTAASTFTHPASGTAAVRPHARSTLSSTGTGAVSGTYAYDAAGNTTTRPAPGGNQTLTWTPEGQIGSVAAPAGITSYTYDADGQRLLRKDATGTTLYLGDDEIRFTTSSGTLASTRYYTFSGRTVALRTSSTAFSVLTPDHQGTATYAVDESVATQTLTTRRSRPFGETRGTQPGVFAGSKGFVGGTKDPTGLTQLGARPYDPDTGRFLAVDPLLDPVDPQQWNAYAYSNNNPVTYSDPSGLKYMIDDGQQNRPKARSSNWFTDPNGIKSIISPPKPFIGPKAITTTQTLVLAQQRAPKAAAPLPPKKQNPVLKALHVALPVVGFVPVYGEAFDAVDGVIYAAQGQWSNAGISAIGVIPFTGIPSGATRLGRTLADAGDGALAAASASRSWTVDALSTSGARIVSGDLTRAGQEFAKHCGQGLFPVARGSQSAISQAAQQQLDDILTLPGKRVEDITQGNFAGGAYYIAPDGRGAAFDSSGVFQYFGVFTP